MFILEKHMKVNELWNLARVKDEKHEHHKWKCMNHIIWSVF